MRVADETLSYLMLTVRRMNASANSLAIDNASVVVSRVQNLSGPAFTVHDMNTSSVVEKAVAVSRPTRVRRRARISPSAYVQWRHTDHGFMAQATVSALRWSSEDLSRKEALEQLADLETLIAWTEAKRAELVVAAAGIEPEACAEAKRVSGRSVQDIHACELGAVLGMSANAAMNLTHTSRMLCRWLPATMRLFRRGQINRVKARIIADGVSNLINLLGMAEPEVIESSVRYYENLVTRHVSTRTNSDLRKRVDQAVHRIAPAQIEQRHREARANRNVEMFDAGDGMSVLNAYLPTLDATRVWNVLERHAKTHRDADTSHTARMADALVAIVDGSTEMAPEVRNRAAQVQVVVSLASLLGVTDDAAEVRGGHGWLTAETVRELAETSPLRRLIVDDVDGQLLHYGRTIYRPPMGLRDHIVARDTVCRAPGCSRPATHCEVDHIQPWDGGGATDVSNLASLCRRHHLLKTFEEWEFELADDGSTQWTLPSGIKVADPPKSVLTLADDPPPF